jgi:sugar phosphate permease
MSTVAENTRRPSHRVFRGWWIVVVAIIGQSCGIATVLVYTFAVFEKPLAHEFKSSRASIALAVSLLDIAVTLSAPLVGRLVDRYGTRRIIVASLFTLAACLVGLSYVQPPLWHLYLLYVLAGSLGVATSPVTYSRVIANWFDRMRGRALGFSGIGTGLGAFIGPSLAQFFIDQRGWRYAYLGLAGFTLLLAMPVVAIFLRGSPEEVGLLPDGDSRSDSPELHKARLPGLTLSEAAQTRTFWLLCGIFFVVAGCCTGTISHVASLLTDKGVSGRAAAFAVSMFGFASIAGKVGSGYLMDRFFAPRVAGAVFAAAAVGIAMLSYGVTANSAYVAAFLIGLGIGAEADIMPFLISRYFGMHSMAELYGCAFGSYTLGNAAGRYLVAAGFDITGSYRTPLAVAFVMLLIATFATFALARYRKFQTAACEFSSATL